MKRIRPRIFIIFFIIISLFSFTVVLLSLTLWKGDKINYSVLIAGIPLSAIFYLPLSTKIEHYESYLQLFAGWNKVKISYNDIIKINCAASPGAYWLQSYDTRDRRFLLYLPFERKKMAELFDAIKENNPEVAVNVWWYHEERGEEDKKSLFLKTMLKFGLFIVAVCIWDFIMHHI